MTLEAAETIAAQGLAYLTEDQERLFRFLRITGADLEELRAQASARHLLAAVLDYIAADESLLLVFATNNAIPPESIAPAMHLLKGETAS